MPNEKSAEQWTASSSNDVFDGPVYYSRADAIEKYPAWAGLEAGATFFTARATPWSEHIRVSGWRVIDSLRDDAADECGEVADDWLLTRNRGMLNGITDEQVADLTRRLTETTRAWLAEVGETPEFFHVDGIETHTVPAGKEPNPGEQAVS